MPRRWGWLPAPARVAPAPAVVAHLPQLCCAVAPMGAGFCWAQLCLLELFPSAGPRSQHPFPSELSPRPAPVPEVVPRRCPGAPAGRHEVKGARAPGSCPAALEEALLGPELRARSCGGRAAGQEWERGGRTPLAPAERWKVRGSSAAARAPGRSQPKQGLPWSGAGGGRRCGARIRGGYGAPMQWGARGICGGARRCGGLWGCQAAGYVRPEHQGTPVPAGVMPSMGADCGTWGMCVLGSQEGSPGVGTEFCRRWGSQRVRGLCLAQRCSR